MAEPDGSDEIIVPGSVEWLGDMTKIAVTSADEARRRFWAVTDEVARIRRDLSSAEERLARAEREYHDAGKLMHEIWGQLRAELEGARPAKPAAIAPPEPVIRRVAATPPTDTV